MMIGKFYMLLLVDEKHCNKMRITEDCKSTRELVKKFSEMCGLNFTDGYIAFLFEDDAKTTFEFSDETGKILTIHRQQFTTRF